jgi:hypothetical protein
MRQFLGAIAAAVLLLGLATACGDDDGGGADATTTSVAAGEATTTTAGAGGGADGADGDSGGGGGGTATTAAGGGGGVPGDVEAVAQDLADADLGCDDVEPLPNVAGPDGAGQCTLDDTPAYLYTFADNEARDAFIDGNGVIDCTFLVGAGLEFDYVVADRTVVRPEDNDDAEPIAEALDGEVRTITCEAPAG